MLSERILSNAVRVMNGRYLDLEPVDSDDPEATSLPAPQPGRAYMLYMHVPFCERLCPYCSFNRFPFEAARAKRYFANLRAEMQMVARLGYDFDSLYIGGGTPTVDADELAATIRCARDTFSISEVSCETNPNHLVPEVLERFAGQIQRLSVGVQSFDDGLLRQMDRYEKYGGAETIAERVRATAESGAFTSLNVDMIFNFPAQTEEMLLHDLDVVKQTRASQTTFYPLMASPAVEKSLAATVGKVDYARERRFYETICRELAQGPDAPFVFGDAWTFNAAAGGMIDEYIVEYEEYPAIGSGGLSFLSDKLHVNTFSVNEYNERIESGRMSVMGAARFSKRDRMRYRFMMSLFGLRLDKDRWRRDFGCEPAVGLPAEFAFFRGAGAIGREDEHSVELSDKGRYLMVAMMRQFFIGVNGVRDQARSALPQDERDLLFGAGVPVK